MMLFHLKNSLTEGSQTAGEREYKTFELGQKRFGIIPENISGFDIECLKHNFQYVRANLAEYSTLYSTNKQIKNEIIAALQNTNPAIARTFLIISEQQTKKWEELKTNFQKLLDCVAYYKLGQGVTKLGQKAVTAVKQAGSKAYETAQQAKSRAYDAARSALATFKNSWYRQQQTQQKP